MYTMLNVQTGFVYKTSQYKDHSTQLIKTLHFLPKQFMLLFLFKDQFAISIDRHSLIYWMYRKPNYTVLT